MSAKKDILRIVDANFNRSREGLRVCEDIARFIMNSPALTKELKALRHGISGIINSSPGMAEVLIESRNPSGDCGRIPDFKIEVPRRKARDIFTANIERVKESIRVLEEFFKLVDIDLSAKFSRLRFKTYAIEKKAVKRLSSLRYSR
ncbi:MAG: thiamine-phosphate pyrophosphorylase [Candidatus Omnitrophica bacterium]|nr:thiamine-phosphate pyrophosphorylase [Candidatus Omnitrophota bacterium]